MITAVEAGPPQFSLLDGQELGHTSAKTTSIYTTMAVDPRLAGALNKAFGS